MKRIFALISLCVLAVAAALPVEAQYSRGMNRHYNNSRNRSYADIVEIFVSSPGELESRMPKDMYNRVRLLRVEGSLNDKDLKFITKLAKRSKIGRHRIMIIRKACQPVVCGTIQRVKNLCIASHVTTRRFPRGKAPHESQTNGIKHFSVHGISLMAVSTSFVVLCIVYPILRILTVPLESNSNV